MCLPARWKMSCGSLSRHVAEQKKAPALSRRRRPPRPIRRRLRLRRARMTIRLADARAGARSAARQGHSAVELADAHLAAIEKARDLNAFVLETPDQPTDGQARGRKLRARRVGRSPASRRDQGSVRDRRDAHHRCSHILENFVPTYESTVTANLWRDGAVMLGKLNNDEFAWVVERDLLVRPVVSPWRRKGAATRSCGRILGRSAAAVAANLCLGATAPTPAARSASRPPSRASSLKPTYAAARAGASSPSRRRSTRPVPRAHRARLRHPAGSMAAMIQGHHLGRSSGPRYEAAVGKSIKGMKIGIRRIPGARNGGGDRKPVAARRGVAQGCGRRDGRGLAAAHQICAAAYYIVAPARLLQPRAL